MKTRLTSLLVLALCAVGSLSAQPRQKQTETKAEKPRLTEEERIQRQANRMSAELMLDDKTSAKFTDVYQQYLKEMNDCRKENRKAMKESCPQGRTKCTQGEKPALTDAEIEARIEKRFAQQRQMLDIREKYYKELKKILTPKQLQRIYEKHPAAGPRHDKRIGHKHAPAFGHGQHAAPCRECPQQPK